MNLSEDDYDLIEYEDVIDGLVYWCRYHLDRGVPAALSDYVNLDAV